MTVEATYERQIRILYATPTVIAVEWIGCVVRSLWPAASLTAAAAVAPAAAAAVH